MVNSHHTQANRKKIIDREQTGAVYELTLPEQIAFLDKEIVKAEGWVTYYGKLLKTKRMTEAQAQRMIDLHKNLAESLSVKREDIKAKYYVTLLTEQMPTFGGAMQLAGRTK